MTDKKFYQNKEFLKTRNEWYEKLKKSGFDDLEWYDEKTGMGQGSPYLRSKGNPTTGKLRKTYSQSSSEHFRLCRNFLQHGAFYTILQENYNNSGDLQRSFSSFRRYLSSLDSYYGKAESVLFQMYTDGATIRQISARLRQLWACRQVGNPAKRKSSRPFSIFWVKTTLDTLKADCIRWNFSSSEGLLSEEAAEATEAEENEFDPSNNTPVGEGGSI